MKPGQPRLERRSGSGHGDPHPVGDADPSHGHERADHETHPGGTGRDADVGESRVGKRGIEKPRHRVVHAWDLEDATDHGQHGQGPHGNPHRPFPLGYEMAGAGEADVGVLLLAGQRVTRDIGVRQVAVLELTGLRHRLAEEGAEDHPERIDAGEERPEVTGDAEDQEAAAAMVEEGEDVVLREPTRKGRQARQGQAAH